MDFNQNQNSFSGEWRLWKEGSQPKLIETDAFFRQKLAYIHDNPVRKGYILDAEHWKWSSANPESPIKLTRLPTVTEIK